MYLWGGIRIVEEKNRGKEICFDLNENLKKVSETHLSSLHFYSEFKILAALFSFFFTLGIEGIEVITNTLVHDVKWLAMMHFVKVVESELCYLQ